MPHLILTTCGTSLLGNVGDLTAKDAARKWANDADGDIPPGPCGVLEATAAESRARLAASDLEAAAKLSAELNGIVRFYEGRLAAAANRSDVHVLLASDTFVGRLTRDIVGDWLRARAVGAVVPLDVKDLRTSSLADFRTGTSDLTAAVGDLVRDYRARGYSCHFNLTGGFKSVNAYLQVLGALWADEVFFVFESAPELMRIPKLQVKLDIEGAVTSHFAEYRRLVTLDAVPRATVPSVPEGFCFAVGDEVQLSPWVMPQFDDVRSRLYSERVWPSWHEHVVFAPAFAASVSGLPADRNRLVNQRIDDLCRFAATSHNPRRLDVKNLKGGAVRGSTHEADAWSDRDARRLFLHRDGPRWVVDRLDHALH